MRRLVTREAIVKVLNEQGLHARPVTEFVQLANRFQSRIQVFKDNTAVDGKSVASMLTLGAVAGTELRIRAKGLDAAQAVKKLAALLAAKCGGR